LNTRRATVLGSLAFALVAALGIYHFYPFSPLQTSQGARSAARAGGTPVTTAVAKEEDFAIRRRTIGVLESPATVVVKSRLESQVTQQHIRDGQLVNEGDLLFTLDDREVKATIARDQAQIEKDQATADRTQLDLDRYQRLSGTNAVARQQVDQAIADHKVALATVDADKAQLNTDNLQLDYATIRAPISGRIGAIRVTPGNLISVNDASGLVTITQVRPIRVSFSLPERDLDLLREASAKQPPAVVRVYAAGESRPLATGELDFVDSMVDTTSGTIAAKAQFDNEDFKLWPGGYVDVEIDLDVRPKTVLVPTVAIQSGQNGPFVFTMKDGQTVAMRMIELAGTEGDRTALASGVQGGEKVVVEGQMSLTNGARVAEVPAPKPEKVAGDAAPRGPLEAEARQ
jgi:multidrug efflux system membrane fusion protein